MSVTAVEPNHRPNPSRAFWRGFLATVPMQIATIPFGLVFGALAIEIGLNVTETMTMTALIVGGVSQLVALNMLAEQAPPLMVVLTAALVNLRMAMYSAAIAARWQGVGPLPRVLAAWFLNDQSFAISLRRYDEHPQMPAAERSAFFLGSGACCFSVWTCATLVGALAGAGLPEDWPLEFAVPVVFIAASAPFLRRWPNLAAGLTACTLAVVLRDLPHSLGLIAGSLAGIGVGMVLSEMRR
jgi:4-azaleucine resistance transporter AzlC